MSSFDVILFPTDFSEDSDQAFQLACSLGRDQFSSLVVAHVLPPTNGPESEEDVIKDDGPVVRECREHFCRLKALAGDIPISFRIVFGYAVGAILNVAHEEHADLIVIASHQHTRFHLQLHGSVAEGVLRQSHCPVMILRQPGQPRTVGGLAAATSQHG